MTLVSLTTTTANSFWSLAARMLPTRPRFLTRRSAAREQEALHVTSIEVRANLVAPSICPQSKSIDLAAFNKLDKNSQNKILNFVHDLARSRFISGRGFASDDRKARYAMAKEISGISADWNKIDAEGVTPVDTALVAAVLKHQRNTLQKKIEKLASATASDSLASLDRAIRTETIRAVQKLVCVAARSAKLYYFNSQSSKIDKAAEGVSELLKESYPHLTPAMAKVILQQSVGQQGPRVHASNVMTLEKSSRIFKIFNTKDALYIGDYANKAEAEKANPNLQDPTNGLFQITNKKLEAIMRCSI